MLEILNQLVIDTHPKQLGSVLKRNTELKEWIINFTINEPQNLSLSERAYLVLNGLHSNKCKNNNIKSFISITKGYRFCGRAANCECARESVSTKVSITKQSVTNEEQIAINQKRSNTNIEKYGVKNVGQTLIAKNKHKEFYSDSNAIASQVKKHKATMIERYGVDNPLKLDSIKEKVVNTTRERYGVDNINQLPERRKALKETAVFRTQQVKESNFWFNRLNTKYRLLSNVEFAISADEYKGSENNIWYPFRCLSCSNKFETWISAGHLPVCKKCFPTVHLYKSGEENEIFEYIKSLGIYIEQRNRTLINPFEIDMIIPDRKIAIEYCGLYWHSESSNNKNKIYHLNKMKLCEEKGYRLITIFSDEWNLKKNIVKIKLKNILGFEFNHIAARKCLVKSIETDAVRTFYDKNHLQGYTNAQINIGLTYNDTLVACMSFGSARAFTHISKQINSYELIRYASSINVQGGAGKLLSYFEKQYKPNIVFSYADARWSYGNMYYKLGFTQINKKLNPGYWYTNDYSTREHRYNFTKNSLVKQGHDPCLTEWEIMQSIGYDRIWDCGQYKFEKIYTK